MMDPKSVEARAVRMQALDSALRWYSFDGTSGDLWVMVARMERYLMAGDAAEPEADPEPVLPPGLPTFSGLIESLNRAGARARAQARIIKAAEAWYDKIPDGSNVGMWAGDEDMTLINAVRALRELPEFDLKGDGPWTK